MDRYDEDPPFEPGTTMKGYEASTGSNVLVGGQHLGKRCAFEDVDWSAASITGNRPRLSEEKLVAVCLRNTSGVTLLGKRFATLDTTAGRDGVKNVTGYSTTLGAGPCVLIDPFLPSTGVLDDYLFWGFIEGPCTALTPTVAADFSLALSVGAPLVAATAATSQTSSAGRVSNITLAGQTAGTASFSMARNMLGYALSSRTTDVTNSDILMRLAIVL